MYYAWSVVVSMVLSFVACFVWALIPGLRSRPGAIASTLLKANAEAIPASPRFWLLTLAIFGAFAGSRYLLKR